MNRTRLLVWLPAGLLAGVALVAAPPAAQSAPVRTAWVCVYDQAGDLGSGPNPRQVRTAHQVGVRYDVGQETYLVRSRTGRPSCPRQLSPQTGATAGPVVEVPAARGQAGAWVPWWWPWQPRPTRTVTVTAPASTVPGPTVTQTVPGPTVTVPGPTVTVPGPTVTVPGPTQTVPGPTVTVPGPTVTVPGPIQTVPGPTVTRTVTATAPTAPTVSVSVSRGKPTPPSLPPDPSVSVSVSRAGRGGAQAAVRLEGTGAAAQGADPLLAVGIVGTLLAVVGVFLARRPG